jgi:hypothetical protein
VSKRVRIVKRAIPGTLPTTCSRWYRLYCLSTLRIKHCKDTHRENQLKKVQQFCAKMSGVYGPDIQCRTFWHYLRKKSNETRKPLEYKTGVCINNALADALANYYTRRINP